MQSEKVADFEKAQAAWESRDGMGTMSKKVADFEKAQAHRADAIKGLIDEWEGIAAAMKHLNEEKKAVREQVEALGLDPIEFAAIVRMRNADPEKLARKLRTRREVCRLVGVPDQLDLFKPPAEAVAQATTIAEEPEPDSVDDTLDEGIDALYANAGVGVVMAGDDDD